MDAVGLWVPLDLAAQAAFTGGGIGGRCNTGGAWNPGNTAIDPTYGTGEGIYNPPATNYVIECWLLIDPDVAGSGWFFGSGSGDFSSTSLSFFLLKTGRASYFIVGT